MGLVLAWAVAQGGLLQFENEAQAAGLANAVFILGAVLSLLAHEAAQGLIARAVGLRGRGGGLLGCDAGPELREAPRACAAELAMGAAGPVIALLLSIAAILVARLAYLAGGPDPLVRALAAVASLNIVIAGANLLPILPLDGGRLLRAAVWGFTHDLERASRVATAVSKVAVLLIVAAGLAAALVDSVGDALSWILIGALLFAETRAEHDNIVRR